MRIGQETVHERMGRTIEYNINTKSIKFIERGTENRIITVIDVLL